MNTTPTMYRTKHNTDSTDRVLAVVQSQLTCRCCNQPGLHAFVQRLPTRDLVMCHCENRACALAYQTRDLDDWLTMDVSQWDAQQHVDWRLPEELDYLLRRE